MSVDESRSASESEREFPTDDPKWPDHIDPEDCYWRRDEPWSTDERGDFRILAGSQEPTDGDCNFHLSNYESRYGEVRYCNRTTPDDHITCKSHRTNEEMISMRAQEALQHGVHAESIDHHYSHLDPWKQVVAHGLKESLFGDSIYEFGEEYEPRRFDFSDTDHSPTLPDEAYVEPRDDEGDGPVIQLDVPYPTEKNDRALVLWAAALDTIKMIDVQRKIVESEMETTSTEHASLTSPTENDPSQVFKTIDEVNEHHLNLPYSRLVKDRKELLKYGGVPVEGETDALGSSADEIDFDFDEFKEDITPDGETVVTDEETENFD